MELLGHSVDLGPEGLSFSGHSCFHEVHGVQRNRTQGFQGEEF